MQNPSKFCLSGKFCPLKKKSHKYFPALNILPTYFYQKSCKPNPTVFQKPIAKIFGKKITKKSSSISSRFSHWWIPSLILCLSIVTRPKETNDLERYLKAFGCINSILEAFDSLLMRRLKRTVIGALVLQKLIYLGVKV
ncbi:hypothetical protein KFK09_003209 [Dendrobium nobile]|uniref:Uncharacterized protein n=1 Tax=Dendrobium nobile TaxID=94219 RepID=A0A8T3C3U5_DENNO|nr:hypothetical protein KFK09_003209 [Dendrobium nobile]